MEISHAGMVTFNDVMGFEVILLLCILTLFLLPLVPNVKLRYYTCYICYVLACAWGTILIAPIALMRPKNLDNMRLTARFIRPFSEIIGIKWELRNGKILRENQVAIIVANHQSVFDTMGMFSIWDVMDKCTAIAKKELLYAIPFGPVSWLSGLIFVDRENKTAAFNKLNIAVEVVKKEKAKLWIYPEGTRNKESNDILPFKNGAFKIAIEAGVPIIPLVYSPYNFIDSKNKSFYKGKIIISVLEPFLTEGLTSNDIIAVKEKIHKLMSDEFQKLKKETAVAIQQQNLNN